MEMEPSLPVPAPPQLKQVPARVEALSGLSAIPTEYVRPADERAGLGDALELARAHAGDHTAPRIPVVDISPFLLGLGGRLEEKCVEAVRAAAADWGVMHISGHGIPGEVMDHLRAAGAAFFALPIEAKEAYANDPAAGRLQGYGSRLATNASGQREWEDYLFHLLHPDSLADHALWPAHPPDYVAATRDFGRRIRDLASALLAVLSVGLLGPGRGDALEKALITTRAGEEEHHDDDDDDLRLQLKINYYPRCPQPELAVGVEAHTDVSALSFIVHNGVPGLQVRHGGRWVTARDEPGTIIVHVGDALEILSNGRYTSVLHRGLVNRDAVRVSWVVFCEPPPDAVLLRPMQELVTPDNPARFPPRTFKQHIDSKLFKKHQQQLPVPGDDEQTS